MPRQCANTAEASNHTIIRGNATADANSNIRAYSKLYTFLNARSNTLLAEISPLRLISVLAPTEREARNLLAGFSLVFVSCKPQEKRHVA
ncbi:host cell division inhibitor Icd-like protein [Yersinia aldovae]|uniref:host cell division inhibitor Icd-like protein n=1 Tax=Yersinia aldovae TaxID=29483 RepID=UPI00119F1501|nr:host cell division inhibitor Icd-like protein [Yersinia aldovae]